MSEKLVEPNSDNEPCPACTGPNGSNGTPNPCPRCQTETVLAPLTALIPAPEGWKMVFDAPGGCGYSLYTLIGWAATASGEVIGIGVDDRDTQRSDRWDFARFLKPGQSLSQKEIEFFRRRVKRKAA